MASTAIAPNDKLVCLRNIKVIRIHLSKAKKTVNFKKHKFTSKKVYKRSEARKEKISKGLRIINNATKVSEFNIGKTEYAAILRDIKHSKLHKMFGSKKYSKSKIRLSDERLNAIDRVMKKCIDRNLNVTHRLMLRANV